MLDETYFDEDTLIKVYKVLQEVGINLNQATDAVTNMLNAGILFRERKPC